MTVPTVEVWVLLKEPRFPWMKRFADGAPEPGPVEGRRSGIAICILLPNGLTMASESASASAVAERHERTAAEHLDWEPRMYVDGDWVTADDGETFDTRDPTTGAVLAAVPSGGAADVDAAVTAARQAYEETWGEYTAAERRDILHAVATGSRRRRIASRRSRR